jgi:DNA-binding NtrC family response regulator
MDTKAGVAQKQRVLVIDDDVEILGVYKELLSGRGFEVTVCSNSSEAIPAVKSRPFDLVVLDIRMPGIEGDDLLPLIKRISPDMPVIVASAYCDNTNAGYYRGLGAFETVSKPFTHEMILDVVSRAIEHRDRIPLVLTGLSLREARDSVYRKLILAALQRTNWNQLKAAELLGVSRYCLMRWIKKLGISY